MIAIHKLTAFEKYLLHQADNGLVFSHRLSEWCGQAPELEIEMGLANIALDHLGQSRLWLDALVASLRRRGITTTEDEIAYLRDEREYFNLLLLEQPNGDYAMTVTKMFFYVVYQRLLYKRLKSSEISEVTDIVAKADLEAGYHEKFAHHWIEVMVNGSEESRRRTQEAVSYLWPYCGEFFKLATFEKEFFNSQTSLDGVGMKEEWLEQVLAVIRPLTRSGLSLDESLNFYFPSGKENQHSEYLGYLLGEFQSLHRRHQGVKW